MRRPPSCRRAGEQLGGVELVGVERAHLDPREEPVEEPAQASEQPLEVSEQPLEVSQQQLDETKKQVCGWARSLDLWLLPWLLPWLLLQLLTQRTMDRDSLAQGRGQLREVGLRCRDNATQPGAVRPSLRERGDRVEPCAAQCAPTRPTAPKQAT